MLCECLYVCVCVYVGVCCNVTYVNIRECLHFQILRDISFVFDITTGLFPFEWQRVVGSTAIFEMSKPLKLIL